MSERHVLDHTASAPAMRPPRPREPVPTRPHTWAPDKFSGSGLRIPITKYRISGVQARAEQGELSFNMELLRFTLTNEKNDATIIDFTQIKHVDIQEVPRRELIRAGEAIPEFPHLRENEAECFGAPASYIKLPISEKLAEIRYGNAFELSVLYISSTPENLKELKDLISNLGGDENVTKFATSVRYDRYVHRKLTDALSQPDPTKTFGLREFKLILSDHLNINQSEKYKDWFNEFSHSATGTMNLAKLQDFFNAFMLDHKFISNVILNTYKYSKKGIGVAEFHNFFKNEQNEDISKEKRKFILNKRVSGKKSTKKSSYVSIMDFYTMLFSRENDVIDKKKLDNMAYSLNYYWINSSHNTYLMGNQTTADSSVEAYIRVLLQGCRCVELDCHDGPNSDPIVWHHKTLCSKIKLFDVLKGINRFAFVTTDYPVILSIENHLCIEQQKVMASMMKHVFKSKLVMYDLFPQDTNIPSPEDLKRKIIIKNKKIQTEIDEDDDADEVDDNDEECQPNDVYASISDIQADTMSRRKEMKRFYVYMNDSVDGEVYSYGQVAIQGCYLYFKEERDRLSQNTEMMKHQCNCWYFGAISRQTAEQVVHDFIKKRYVTRGIDEREANGSFLVRRSGTPLTGNYNVVITMYKDNGIRHVMVKTEKDPETGRLKYKIDNSGEFETVEKLINFYHCNDSLVKSEYFKQLIPNPEHYQNKLWYKGEMERTAAEQLLLKQPRMMGKFLVRDRVIKGHRIGYTISFLNCNPDAPGSFLAQHVSAKEIGPFIKITDDLRFWSVNQLVEHFTQNPITNQGNVKLTMICKDGAHFVNSSSTDNVTIELIENYPYKDGDLKIMLLKGMQLHNAVKKADVNENGEPVSVYVADLGTRVGIKVDEAITNLVKDETPFGSKLKCKTLIEKQLVASSASSEYFVFNTPISTITMKFVNSKEVHQFMGLFDEAAVSSSAASEFFVKKGLSKELSDLVVYCQSVKIPKPFKPAKIDLMQPYQMCSFTELTIDRFAKDRNEYMNLNRFCQKQLARMFPAWKRFDSSNFNPIMPWAYGMQLVALNFQTPDLSMQLNHGMFCRNQQKGYVIKPDFLRKEQYDPNNHKTYLAESNSISVTVKILTGRLISLPKHWNKSGCYVLVTHHGVGPGQIETKKSTIDKKPGISPKWYQDLSANTMTFNIAFPQLSILQFVLYSTSGEILGQRCVPVDYIREGYRSIILHNIYDEEIELAALLVHTSTACWTPFNRCDRQDLNYQKENELQKKATDLHSVITANVKYRKATREDLADQQTSLESYLRELFELKYSNSFILSLENPIANVGTSVAKLTVASAKPS